nr:signal recognition particle-docking protein FtsY [Haloplasma contractile]
MFSKNNADQKTKESADKYKEGMAKTRGNMVSKLKELFSSYENINDELFDELEEIFIMADIGVDTVLRIIDELKSDVRVRGIENPNELQKIIVDKMFEIYVKGEIVNTNLRFNKDGLTVLLFVGVNGVGKTTSIGKVAHRLKQDGKKVMMAAGDTFRAGAINQLKVWGERANCEVISREEGSDPSSVIFDAINRAKEAGADVLLCDTAGRLQNKVNLMKELEKINRVIGREIEGAPHETLLTIDATTGQNGMSQAKAFMEATNVSGIVLTKLDGTAKGGIVLAIRNELGLPIKFVALGEKIDDIEYFDIEKYIYGLFSELFEEGE